MLLASRENSIDKNQCATVEATKNY